MPLISFMMMLVLYYYVHSYYLVVIFKEIFCVACTTGCLTINCVDGIICMVMFVGMFWEVCVCVCVCMCVCTGCPIHVALLFV